MTEENKREYVNLVARHRMTTAIKPQINSFLEGFWDLVPKVSAAVTLQLVHRNNRLYRAILSPLLRLAAAIELLPCIPVLYCTALYCPVLYCTVLYCTVLYCTVLYCTVLYCITLSEQRLACMLVALLCCSGSSSQAGRAVWTDQLLVACRM